MNYYIDKQTAKTRKKTDIRRKSKMMIPERFAIAMIESGRISLNLISENNRRVTIDNAIVITEEE